MIDKEKVTKALNNIKVSEKLDEKILESTIYKSEKKNTYKKFVFSKKILTAVLILLVFTTTTVFAKDFIYNCILNLIQKDDLNYNQNISLTDPVNINENASISCDNISTLSELESALGIKFIFNTSKYNNKINKCDIKTNDNGNIESIEISVLEFYDYSNDNKDIDLEYSEDFTQEEYMTWNSKRKMVDLHITFMTQYASSKTKEEYKNYNIISSTGGHLKAQEFFAENINTSGYYFVSPSENIPLRKDLIFVNNNILYEFSANKPVELQELLEIIKEF